MGPVGSGKGTQGELLSAHLSIPLISVGQILREIESDHPWYKEINDSMKSGKLVDQAKVAEILKQTVQHEDYQKGYIMDGWGRALIDLTYFDPEYDKVILIDISPQESVSRLSTRRTCETCGAVYNIVTKPPKEENVCDKCGGELKQRPDDTEQAIMKRLDIYNHETKETIEKFRSEGKLIEVSGEKSPEEVFEDIKFHL